MIQKLCMSCSSELRSVYSMQYLGKKNHMDICERCGRKTYVTEYDLKESSAVPAERNSRPISRTDVTINVDVRTAVNMQRLADRWGCSCGEVVDSWSINFNRKRKGK